MFASFKIARKLSGGIDTSFCSLMTRTSVSQLTISLEGSKIGLGLAKETKLFSLKDALEKKKKKKTLHEL